MTLPFGVTPKPEGLRVGFKLIADLSRLLNPHTPEA